MIAKGSETLLLLSALFAVIPMFFIPISLYVLIPFVFFLLVTIFLLFFFRDPKRVSPVEEGIMVAPADGKVRKVEKLDDDSTEIQIELSVFNVHVNRTPIDCKVLNIEKIKGAHWPVWYKGHFATANARQHFDLEATKDNFQFRLTQISGIFAWRCVSYVKVGQELKQNDRIGIIRFGSAANIILPKNSGYEPLVAVGDKIRAGETIIARKK